jgi:hypothetical protein
MFTMSQEGQMKDKLLELKGDDSYEQMHEKTGIGSSTMFNYLHGRDVPGRMIVKICLAYGVSADWLLGLNDTKVAAPTLQRIGNVWVAVRSAMDNVIGGDDV